MIFLEDMRGRPRRTMTARPPVPVPFFDRAEPLNPPSGHRYGHHAADIPRRCWPCRGCGIPQGRGYRKGRAGRQHKSSLSLDICFHIAGTTTDHRRPLSAPQGHFWGATTGSKHIHKLAAIDLNLSPFIKVMSA
jgi:hypothetical protein